MKIKLTLLLMTVMVFLGITGTCHAEGFAFNIEPTIPENQLGDNHSFLNLKMAPNQTQILTFKVRNDSENDQVYRIYFNNATTANDGHIDYTNTTDDKHSSLKYPLKELITAPKELAVKANSSEHFEAELKMPDEKIEGIILGGLFFVQESPEDSEQKETGMAIKNNMAFNIPIMLSMQDNKLKAKLELDRVKPMVSSGHTVLNIPLENPVATMLPGVDLAINVQKEGSQKDILTDKVQDLEFAPNSVLPYNLSWENQSFKPGKYVADITAKSEYGKWHWEKKFVIKKDEAKKLNQDAVWNKKTTPWVYAVIGAFILLILLVFYLLYRLKKQTSNKDIN